MTRFNAWNVIKNGFLKNPKWDRQWRDPEPKKEYDIIIVGAGLHGLATAFYLAKNHNIKIVAAISWELFQRQPVDYRSSIISDQEWMDAMVITNGALRLMHKWVANRVVVKYSMSPDFDNRWRTGGSLEEIVAESKLDPTSIWEGINRFAKEREQRLNSVRDSIPV